MHNGVPIRQLICLLRRRENHAFSDAENRENDERFAGTDEGEEADCGKDRLLPDPQVDGRYGLYLHGKVNAGVK